MYQFFYLNNEQLEIKHKWHLQYKLMVSVFASTTNLSNTLATT